MIRLITPPGLLVTVALLAIYTAYGCLIGTIERSWILLAGALLSAIACVGVALLKPWSRFLVYLLTFGFIAKLAQSIYWGIKSGYFSFQFGSVEGAVRSVLPSLTLVSLSLMCCWLLDRHFSKHSPQTRI